jgi:hypothetical protein
MTAEGTVGAPTCLSRKAHFGPFQILLTLFHNYHNLASFYDLSFFPGVEITLFGLSGGVIMHPVSITLLVLFQIV